MQVDPLYASLICCLIWTKYLDRVSVLKVKTLLLLDAEAIVEAFCIIPSVLDKKVGDLANTLVLNPPVTANLVWECSHNIFLFRLWT
jgi:hypothetical protein